MLLTIFVLVNRLPTVHTYAAYITYSLNIDSHGEMVKEHDNAKERLLQEQWLTYFLMVVCK